LSIARFDVALRIAARGGDGFYEHLIKIVNLSLEFCPRGIAEGFKGVSVSFIFARPDQADLHAGTLELLTVVFVTGKNSD
jgi:hypothetical protein